jgi:hypothetical protein
MSANPQPNRQVPHEEVLRRFLARVGDDVQLRRPEPKGWLPPNEPLVTLERAIELARWFAL